MSSVCELMVKHYPSSLFLIWVFEKLILNLHKINLADLIIGALELLKSVATPYNFNRTRVLSS